MKNKKFLLLIVGIISVTALVAFTNGKSTEEQDDLKYYLMIGEPEPEVWKAIIENGGKDLSKPGREATEALGGKILGYYIGATEAKNYIIIAFPRSIDVSNIVYMRAAQGVMKNLEFIEIIPESKVPSLFEKIKTKEY